MSINKNRLYLNSISNEYNNFFFAISFIIIILYLSPFALFFKGIKECLSQVTYFIFPALPDPLFLLFSVIYFSLLLLFYIIIKFFCTLICLIPIKVQYPFIISSHSIDFIIYKYMDRYIKNLSMHIDDEH